MVKRWVSLKEIVLKYLLAPRLWPSISHVYCFHRPVHCPDYPRVKTPILLLVYWILSRTCSRFCDTTQLRECIRVIKARDFITKWDVSLRTNSTENLRRVVERFSYMLRVLSGDWNSSRMESRWIEERNNGKEWSPFPSTRTAVSSSHFLCHLFTVGWKERVYWLVFKDRRKKNRNPRISHT